MFSGSLIRTNQKVVWARADKLGATRSLVRFSTVMTIWISRSGEAADTGCRAGPQSISPVLLRGPRRLHAIR
ncbi:MAG: hypothetical protein C0629_01260 [Chromatiales bacterium]|nr:MAG: hypothetical protein C0629_01260 [Chromatiales bacterium]